MSNEIQKAGMWKRIAAWMLDAIFLSVLAVGFGYLLANALGYDAYGNTLDAAYARYETEYGVVFDITQEAYQAMDEGQRQNYDAAYAALIADQEAMHAYNMMLSLTLVITTGGLLLGIMLWEFMIPLWLGNGQTLGKRAFSLGLVREDGVRLNTMQLFVRTLLGKFTIETMIPVYILLMLFWGTIDLTGTLILAAMLVGQAVCVGVTRNNSAIHDLLAGTVVVDMSSQTIFRSTEELIDYQKRVAAERAARQIY